MNNMKVGFTDYVKRAEKFEKVGNSFSAERNYQKALSVAKGNASDQDIIKIGYKIVDPLLKENKLKDAYVAMVKLGNLLTDEGKNLIKSDQIKILDSYAKYFAKIFKLEKILKYNGLIKK